MNERIGRTNERMEEGMNIHERIV